MWVLNGTDTIKYMLKPVWYLQTAEVIFTFISRMIVTNQLLFNFIIFRKNTWNIIKYQLYNKKTIEFDSTILQFPISICFCNLHIQNFKNRTPEIVLIIS